MSLDTVLQIGKTLRSSSGGLKHFKYIKSPHDNKKDSILYLNIPVNNDFKFDWENVELVPENRVDKLFYLTFKTSDSDGLVKYIFGDIYYEINSKVKNNGEIVNSEGGYYRIANENAYGLYKKSSFHRAEDDFESIKQFYLNKKGSDYTNELFLNKFRNSFFE
ncbi:MAG TPA: hypothetical protein VKA34_17000, partial [Balneolales bacterium]|nr:hypothetical protein [Balneolales bacterium]